MVSEGEKKKERKRRSVLQSARADGDGMRRPPGHLMTGAGREVVLRKGGGEETRSVRCMCDVCGILALNCVIFGIKIRSFDRFELRELHYVPFEWRDCKPVVRLGNNDATHPLKALF